MRRSLCTGLVLLSSLVAVPVHAGVPGACSFDPNTGTMTVTPQDGLARIVRDGDGLSVNLAPCVGASVTSVDLVTVHAAEGDEVHLDLGGGPFAPGATDEGDGTSEIEFNIVATGFIELAVIGTPGNERLAAGFGATTVAPGLFGPLLNLDTRAGDVDDDVFVHTYFLTNEVHAVSRLTVEGRGGNDTLDAGPAAFPGANLYVGALTFLGGAGTDTLEPGGVGSATNIFHGGPDRDRFDLRAFPASTQSIVDLRTGEGTLGPSFAGFTITSFEMVHGSDGADFLIGRAGAERLLGHAGPDSVIGYGGDDRLDGGAGDDYVYGYGGNDVIRGGTGADRLSGGAGTDHCVRDADDIMVRGCETVRAGSP